jgi:glycerophosphoryl diester phosphodiesterase
MTKDDELIVMHDETVDRTTNGGGRVRDLTSSEIRGLDAGRGAQVPTLAEVCDAVDGQADLVVELKVRGLARAAVCLLHSHLDRSSAMAVSFIASELEAVREADSALRCGILFHGAASDAIESARSAGAVVAGFHQDAVSAGLVDQAHNAGLGLLTWAVNRADRTRELARFHVDYLVTDAPDAVARALGL